MKSGFLTLLLFGAVSSGLLGQEKPWHITDLYAGVGGGLSSDHAVLTADANLVFENQWRLSVGIFHIQREAPWPPRNYEGSLPTDFYHNLSLLVGREVRVNHYFSISPELGGNMGWEAVNRFRNLGGYYDPDYRIDVEKDFGWGATGAVNFRVNMTDWLGVELTGLRHVNRIHSYGAFVLSLNFEIRR